MWAGVECDLIPASPGVAAKLSRDRRKDPKVWLAGELIVRCEHQALVRLPSQLFVKTTLRTLVLTGNALTSIPQDIQYLKELRELKLGHNQIGQLPDEVCSLPNLEHLDVQYNQLQDVPSALCKLVHLSIINLDGNPLNEELQAIWATEADSAVISTAEVGKANARGQQPFAASAIKPSGRQAAAATSTRLKDGTEALMQHLLRQQDPAVVIQIKQNKLQLLQQASAEQISKMLCVADPDVLANCLSAAITTGLSSDLAQRIQQAQAATADMQLAMHAVQALQLTNTSQNSSRLGPDVEAHEQLAASLRKFEAMCKPRRPAGSVYVSAHATWRILQRQVLERGWRCSSPKNAALVLHTADAELPVATALATAAEIAGGSDSSNGSSTVSPAGKRRYLTLPEQTRQRLEAAGAQKFEEWAADKKQRQQTECQHIVELALQEARAKTQIAAERASKAVDNCSREKQWSSKVVEPFPHGTFSLSPEQLKAVRRAYGRPPDMQKFDTGKA